MRHRAVRTSTIRPVRPRRRRCGRRRLGPGAAGATLVIPANRRTEPATAGGGATVWAVGVRGRPPVGHSSAAWRPWGPCGGAGVVGGPGAARAARTIGVTAATGVTAGTAVARVTAGTAVAAVTAVAAATAVGAGGRCGGSPDGPCARAHRRTAISRKTCTRAADGPCRCGTAGARRRGASMREWSGTGVLQARGRPRSTAVADSGGGRAEVARGEGRTGGGGPGPRPAGRPVLSRPLTTGRTDAAQRRSARPARSRVRRLR